MYLQQYIHEDIGGNHGGMIRPRSSLWNENRPLKVSRKNPPGFQVTDWKRSEPLKVSKTETIVNSEEPLTIGRLKVAPKCNITYFKMAKRERDEKRTHTREVLENKAVRKQDKEFFRRYNIWPDDFFEIFDFPMNDPQRDDPDELCRAMYRAKGDALTNA